MFGNYPSYRIGSVQYEEYLKDLFTSQYYRKSAQPEIENVLHEAERGAVLMGGTCELSPEETLLAAAAGRAVIDYIELHINIYENLRKNGGILNPYIWQMKAELREISEFLARFSLTENVLNVLMYEMQDSYRPWRSGPEYVLANVKRSYARFMAGIGEKPERRKQHASGRV